MALPKRRFSRARRDKRRTQLRVRAAAQNRCPQCGALKASHRICPECGTYRGRQILPGRTKPQRGK